MCVANGDIPLDQEADCSLRVQGDDVPLFVTDMTKPGQVQFDADMCKPKSGQRAQVKEWSYRLNYWIKGAPNNFKAKAVGYRWTLQWDRGLDPKYAGLILKFHFTCQHRQAGCLLIKSKGNYTIPNPGSSSATPLPPLGPSDVAIDATGGKTGPTLKSGTSSGINGNEKKRVQNAAETKRDVEAKQTGIVVAGVMVSLAAGILLVFSTFLLMLKKRRALG